MRMLDSTAPARMGTIVSVRGSIVDVQFDTSFRQRGWRGYVHSYLQPTAIMLPFNIISEFSRSLALAVRLFGNMMSGAMILGILLTITPFIFPVAMSALGLLTGMVQAYIFSILATVYIAAATGAGD
jgi:F-type H+-transporting ATPase subunit a